jgi:pimeloyl-ACP methyl ester carboxylesterase
MRVLAGAVVVVIVVLTLAYAFQRRLIYLPSGGPVPPAAQVIPGARDVELTTADGLKLGAWFVPPLPGTDRGYTVLAANGNAGNRTNRTTLANGLRAEGFALLLFDYRGYGGNEGDPSEEGLALDVRAARSYLVDELRIPQERLLYFGDSLGCAVVSELAIEHPPAALVLRSPFTELADVGAVHYPFLPVRQLLKDRLPVVEHVQKIHVPTVVVYGTDDGVVPPEQSRAVAEAAAGPVQVVVVQGAGHNDPNLLAGPQVVAAVVGLVS